VRASQREDSWQDLGTAGVPGVCRRVWSLTILGGVGHGEDSWPLDFPVVHGGQHLGRTRAQGKARAAAEVLSTAEAGRPEELREHLRRQGHNRAQQGTPGEARVHQGMAGAGQAGLTSGVKRRPTPDRPRSTWGFTVFTCQAIDTPGYTRIEFQWSRTKRLKLTEVAQEHMGLHGLHLPGQGGTKGTPRLNLSRASL